MLPDSNNAALGRWTAALLACTLPGTCGMGSAREGGDHLRQRAVLGRAAHALQPPAQDALVLLRQQLYGQIARGAHLRASASWVARFTAPRVSFANHVST